MSRVVLAVMLLYAPAFAADPDRGEIVVRVEAFDQNGDPIQEHNEFPELTFQMDLGKERYKTLTSEDRETKFPKGTLKVSNLTDGYHTFSGEAPKGWKILTQVPHRSSIPVVKGQQTFVTVVVLKAPEKK